MMISPFGIALLYIIGGVLLISTVAALSFLLSPKKPNPEKLTTYECGEDPVGNANIQFNIRFYIIGLIFLIFDVEILFLFPWATVFADNFFIKNIPHWGIYAFAEMTIFVVILLLGLAYVWIKGDLEWVKSAPIVPKRINPVPDALYKEVNQRYS